MHYKLMGFSQDGAIRRFWFHRVEIGVDPVGITVIADTNLSRKFNLTLQELPNLCSQLLDARAVSVSSVLTLTETEMSHEAEIRAALAAEAEAARAVRLQRYARQRKPIGNDT